MTNQEAYRNVVSKLSEEDYNIVADYVTELEHKYCVLEKALDIACMELETADRLLTHYMGGIDIDHNEWKEKLLKESEKK